VTRDIFPETLGRALPIDGNETLPAFIMDVGFPPSALKGFSLLAHTASIIAHLQEETERPIGFIMSGAAADKMQYV
jgi:citrate synthase